MLYGKSLAEVMSLFRFDKDKVSHKQRLCRLIFMRLEKLF